MQHCGLRFGPFCRCGSFSFSAQPLGAVCFLCYFSRILHLETTCIEGLRVLESCRGAAVEQYSVPGKVVLLLSSPSVRLETKQFRGTLSRSQKRFCSRSTRITSDKSIGPRKSAISRDNRHLPFHNHIDTRISAWLFFFFCFSPSHFSGINLEDYQESCGDLGK